MLDQLPACVYQERLQWSSSASKYLVWLVGALSNRHSIAKSSQKFCVWFEVIVLVASLDFVWWGAMCGKGGTDRWQGRELDSTLRQHFWINSLPLIPPGIQPAQIQPPHAIVFWTNELLQALAPPHMIDSRGSLINCQPVIIRELIFLTEVRIWWFVTTLIRACNERAMHLHFKNIIPPSTKLQHLLKAAFIGILTGHSYLNQTPVSYKQQTSITTSCDSLFGV